MHRFLQLANFLSVDQLIACVVLMPDHVMLGDKCSTVAGAASCEAATIAEINSASILQRKHADCP
jgi:hypothetical protein